MWERAALGNETYFDIDVDGIGRQIAMNKSSRFMEKFEPLSNLEKALLDFQLVYLELSPSKLSMSVLDNEAARPASNSTRLFLVILVLQEARQGGCDRFGSKHEAAGSGMLNRLGKLENAGMAKPGKEIGFFLDACDDLIMKLLDG